MNIFYDFEDSKVVTVVELPWTGELKAGTPIDEDGAVANDATAIGILADDVSLPFDRKLAADRAYFVNAKVVYGGFIDKNAAEAHSGITYSDELIGALTDIHFIVPLSAEFPTAYVDEVMAVTFTATEETSEAEEGEEPVTTVVLTADKTVAEVLTAMATMPVIGVLKEDGKDDVMLGIACYAGSKTPAFGLKLADAEYVIDNNSGAWRLNGI